ncbi:hypothetical protein DENIT_70039 [Pseudomonas veronii]|uniref:hypothetical protein n=1 Tax=Pseudomonas veronii TaxID=76761 RepID=UPI0017504C14|nr:hypothetical protein [Pseudomonas veronii]CAD0266062.1 hypothetical protein DENIT_70039 [Pseudomonas veronii]
MTTQNRTGGLLLALALAVGIIIGMPLGIAAYKAGVSSHESPTGMFYVAPVEMIPPAILADVQISAVRGFMELLKDTCREAGEGEVVLRTLDDVQRARDVCGEPKITNLK